MPRLTYQDELPSPKEFEKAVAEAMANTNPVDDLLELANDLWEYERKYQLSSPDFHRQYRTGSLNDELQHCIEWAATYDTFVRTKRKLESALMRAVVQPDILEPAV